MKLIFVIGLLLLLSSISFGKPETQPLGPFIVSFDLNASTPYKIDSRTPIINPYRTLYSIGMFTDNETWAEVNVIEYNNITDATLDVDKEFAVMDMTLSGLNITSVSDRIINDRKGFIVTGEPIALNKSDTPQLKVYRATYWLDSENCDCGPVSVGNTRVDIISTYPFAVTENLLDNLNLKSIIN